MLESSFLFLAFAALGIQQAAPSVTTGDAGEFSSAASASWAARARERARGSKNE